MVRQSGMNYIRNTYNIPHKATVKALKSETQTWRSNDRKYGKVGSKRYAKNTFISSRY